MLVLLLDSVFRDLTDTEPSRAVTADDAVKPELKQELILRAAGEQASL